MMNFGLRPIVKYEYDDSIEVETRHYEDVKILWKPDIETGKSKHRNSEGDYFVLSVVNWPEEDNEPTEERIAAIKKNISKVFKGTGKFSKAILEESYTMLNHPNEEDDKCHYDPLNMENHHGKWKNGQYGVIEAKNKTDLFYSDEL